MIHVGLETVALNGKCFQIHVKEGDKVKAGDLLADADLEFIKETGRNSITPIVIGSSLEGKRSCMRRGRSSGRKNCYYGNQAEIRSQKILFQNRF